MWTRSVFWGALALAFLGLAVVALRERTRIRRLTSPIPMQGLEHHFIIKPVGDALTNILLVELVGFVLAAAAAVYEALT